MLINVESVYTDDIKSLLASHLEYVALYSPSESIHALDLTEYEQPNITLWSARRSKTLLGCGALKELSPIHGEIKSMKTVPEYTRQGVAAEILGFIISEARSRGYKRLSLETGSIDAYLPARRLYEKFGFQICGPFADYVEDPNNVFMTLEL